MAADEDVPSRPQVSPAALIEHSRDLIVVLDATAHITYVNPAVEMFGYQPEEVLGRSVKDFLPADYVDAMTERLQHLRRAGGELPPMRHRLRHADGTWRWVEASHADRLGDPVIRGIVVTIRDITERRRAEQALRESEARFRRLAENAPDIIFRVIPGRPGFDYLSPAVEQLTGYTAEEFYEDPELSRQLSHEGDTAAVDVDTAPEGTTTVRVRHRDGSWRWVERRTVHVTNEHGELVAVEGISRDVTEQRRAEEAYRLAQERFARVIETMGDAVLIFDTDGQLEYVNPAAEELFALPAEVMLERDYTDPAWDLRDAADRPVSLEQRPVHRVLATGEAVSGVELSTSRGDGSRVRWETNASPLLGPGDEVLGVVAVLRNVSAQRAAAAKLAEALERERSVSDELRQLHELKNTFLQAVSHELRTPLTSVMGFADLLEQRDRLSEEQFDQIVRRLRANAVRLDRLLSDLLDLDRLSRGTLEPRRTAVDVLELVSRTVEQLGLVGRVRIKGDPVIAKIDGPRTERIVENLVANAHKHTPSDAEIVAIVREQEGGVVIQVDDRGPGVADPMKEAIFEAFRQGDTPAARAGGAGIGLSLVAAFARLHEGRAWVEDRPGGGASFLVHLPAEVIATDRL